MKTAQERGEQFNRVCSEMGITPEKMRISEAKILQMRWGVKWQAILIWMKARHIDHCIGLRYVFDGSFSEANDKALADFWEFST